MSRKNACIGQQGNSVIMGIKNQNTTSLRTDSRTMFEQASLPAWLDPQQVVFDQEMY